MSEISQLNPLMRAGKNLYRREEAGEFTLRPIDNFFGCRKLVITRKLGLRRTGDAAGRARAGR